MKLPQSRHKFTEQARLLCPLCPPEIESLFTDHLAIPLSSITTVKMSPLLDLSCEHYPGLSGNPNTSTLVPDDTYEENLFRSRYYRVLSIGYHIPGANAKVNFFGLREDPKEWLDLIETHKVKTY